MAKKRQAKRTPQRTCVVCREKDDKRQLTRIVRTAEERVVVDPRGRLSGRGAYLCDRPQCWERALSSNVLDHALKVSIKSSEKEALAAYRARDTIEGTG